ncbi:hypothetical protein Dtox_2443 [Desulfofarcimen acetoxidans DSM 771]|uniref:Integrase family protein n=1 Tax=Desulfofarcimen acetoxidans (strain ATCC 49208 / DSM 771 / KCTC 5769 / VKM B-1644 / 5575) TaxID=485916 RepID=C8W0J7_DESAS|nr:hypothetical protein [Desulfofarcimen acetoxidans]ACV63252.1 hypothetical protein Dtox_2443 [Desulfofarcimen acetoxidans DSM 771]
MDASVTGSKTFDDYKDVCMRWAKDLAERRGTSKFQICSVKPEEIKNFLDRIAMTHRPDTVHQYCAALQKLENMTNNYFGKVEWNINDFEKPKRSRENVTEQRGPAYKEHEADRLISEMVRQDKRAADALLFIRATGCRAETIFGRQMKKGGKVVVNGVVVKGTKVFRDFSKAVKAERIDLVKGTVTLTEKGGKTRTVAYDRKYQKFMERLVNDNPTSSIFVGLKQPTVYNRIKRISSETGFTGRGLHGMRKTFAVQRHADYTHRINELVNKKDWLTLSKEFQTSEQKAKELCRKPYTKTVDNLARLKLTKDLGHNRIEVTFRYVPKTV